MTSNDVLPPTGRTFTPVAMMKAGGSDACGAAGCVGESPQAMLVSAAAPATRRPQPTTLPAIAMLVCCERDSPTPIAIKTRADSLVCDKVPAGNRVNGNFG